MIAATLILLAAVCKAVADTIAHHKRTSIFKSSDFWSNGGRIIKGTKYRFDGWHISNSGMIICFVVAAVLHEPVLAWYWEILIGGAVFNLVFNLFYNKILR